MLNTTIPQTEATVFIKDIQLTETIKTVLDTNYMTCHYKNIYKRNIPGWRKPSTP